jgi:hypothetical protein
VLCLEIRDNVSLDGFQTRHSVTLHKHRTEIGSRLGCQCRGLNDSDLDRERQSSDLEVRRQLGSWRTAIVAYDKATKSSDYLVANFMAIVATSTSLLICL